MKDLNKNMGTPNFKPLVLSRSHCLHLHAYDRYILAFHLAESKMHFTCNFDAVPSCKIGSKNTVKPWRSLLNIPYMAVQDAKQVLFSTELFNSCSVASNVISVLDSALQICHICNCCHSLAIDLFEVTNLHFTPISGKFTQYDCRETSYNTGFETS